MCDVLKFFFNVLVVFGSDNYFTLARRCFDCVSITSCESGLQFAANAKVLENQLGFIPRERRLLFNNAICGTDTYDPSIPKVCCSDFPRLDNRFKIDETTTEKATEKATEETMTVANEETTTIPDKDEIEMHRNLRLLPNDMCGEIDGSRIYGGKVPMLYELPWMTLIAYNKRRRQKYRCGGSIINSRYILTAAHCVIKDGKLRTNIASVRIGEFDLSSSIDCQGDYDNMICESNIQDIGIEEIIPHEDFTGIVPQQADIALLRLNKSITFRNNVAPICLPVYSALRRDYLGGKNATVAGWGATENNTRSNKLLKAIIPILTDDVCALYYRRFDQNLLEKSFCAGELGKDPCGGDSGGPLIIESDFGDSIRMVQFGIISFGPRQCGIEFPGAYTDVTKYMDWILDNIRE